jgi:CheY-like chemotaxis protein
LFIVPLSALFTHPIYSMMNRDSANSGVILCLDDDVNGLAARTALLSLAGFEVLSASDPDEALDLLKSHKVDLIISDHFLKAMTGTELSKTFKTLRPTIPILILSGSIRRPAELGSADDFMYKTDGPRALIEIAHRMIARCKALDT